MRLVTAGTALGFGLGGLVDGIVLHQLMQWHNMGSAVLPPITMAALHTNMFWDGLFHAGSWVVVFAGVWMLWAESRLSAPTARALSGEMLFGWGAFNAIEGVIDHHLLDLHHVRDLPEHVPAYDWAFLGIGGVLFMLIGWLIATPARRRLPA